MQPILFFDASGRKEGGGTKAAAAANDQRRSRRGWVLRVRCLSQVKEEYAGAAARLRQLFVVKVAQQQQEELRKRAHATTRL